MGTGLARDPITLIGVRTTRTSMSFFRRDLEESIIVVETNKVADEIVVAAKVIVPKLTHSLEKTIRKEKAARRSESEKTILATIKAGGPSSPIPNVNYANKVHEEHPTGSKYIERPTLELTQDLPNRFKRSFSRLRSTAVKPSGP